MGCSCGGVVFARGLCAPCYRRAYRAAHTKRFAAYSRKHASYTPKPDALAVFTESFHCTPLELAHYIAEKGRP